MSKPIAYNGDEPYIFVSYSHTDEEKVWEILNGFMQRGYRFWYDDGVEPGSSWDDYIAAHLQHSGLVSVFLSKAYLNSINCVQELRYALMLDKTVILTYLDDCELSTGMQMRLCTSFALKYDAEDSIGYFEKLNDAEGLKKCCVREKEQRVAYRDLRIRSSRAMKQSFYYEAMFLQREMIDDRLSCCLYDLGLTAGRYAVRVRDKVRPMLQEMLGDETNLGIRTCAGKLALVAGVTAWVNRGDDTDRDKYRAAIAAQYRTGYPNQDAAFLHELEMWLNKEQSMVNCLMKTPADPSADESAELATDGTQYVQELEKLEKKLRRSNRIRLAAGLKTENL